MDDVLELLQYNSVCVFVSRLKRSCVGSNCNLLTRIAAAMQ